MLEPFDCAEHAQDVWINFDVFVRRVFCGKDKQAQESVPSLQQPTTTFHIPGPFSLRLGAEDLSITMLSSLRTVEEQRRNATAGSVSRVDGSNIDNVLLSDGGDQPFCHMIAMHSYWEVLGLGPISLTATALALEHLNAGNGVIVPQLEGLGDRCSIKFTLEHLDTEGDKLVALRSLLSILQRTPQEMMPCAFLGNIYSEVSEATSAVTGIMGFPQVSVTSSAEVLERQSSHPLFARVALSAPDHAAPLLEYLYTSLDVRNVAVIVSDTEAQVSFVTGMLKHQRNFEEFSSIRVVNVPVDATEDDYSGVVKSIEDIGFHYIVAALAPHDVVPLMEAADKRGLVGGADHVWVHTASLLAKIAADHFGQEDPLRSAIDGALLYELKKRTPGNANYDKYVEQIEALWDSDEDRSYLISKLPEGHDSVASFKRGTSIYDPMDSVGAMMYDSAILVGLSACEAGGSNFTGAEHFDRILDTSFFGASGKVSLLPDSRARDPSTLEFSLSNFQPVQIGGNYTFKQVAVAEYKNATWDSQNEILFAGGFRTTPPDLPELDYSYNYISTVTRAAGYTMSGTILFASLVLSIWTFRKQRAKSHVIRAAQPIFLHMICLGTFLMGCAIIPAGFDDRSAYADLGCVSTPWFLCLGWCITFSSLFSKTRRVNKVFHNPRFRRVVVTLKDVIRPMLAMVGLNVAILLAWSILSPMYWKRLTGAVDRFGRVVESRGMCASDRTLAFGLPLLTINIAALIFANYQAFVARKIATEFAESEYIARSMSLILVVIFIGLPSAVIAGEDSSVFFFVFSGLVFVASMSILMFMFVPKIMFSIASNTKDRLETAIESSMISCGSGGNGDFGASVIEHPKMAEERIRLLQAELASLKSELITSTASKASVK